MAIETRLYDTSTLLGVMADLPPVPNYWLTLGFGRQVNFQDEYIDFEKLTRLRKLAPFVAPTAQGRPIYSEGSTVTRFKPAYVKPKDAVNPNRMIQKRAGELVVPGNIGPQARWNAVVADIIREHRESIERRWEWMAAQAMLYGAVTVVGQDYPERVVDFGRDPGNTVTLTGANTWDGTSADIIGDLNEWRAQVRNVKFGGPVSRATLGTLAWDALSKDPEVRKQLDTQVRGTSGDIITGVREGQQIEYMGRLGTLDLYVYSDYYEQADGTVVPFMDPRDVLLSSPAVDGVRAFGAILDQHANFASVPIFTRMFDENDPPLAFVMSQSAPLMVPVNPNATLRARVIA